MMTVPLSVRLQRTGGPSVHITDEVADLTFSANDPGGYAECTTTLHRPISRMPQEVSQFSFMTVFDTRNGETVWDGRLEDPGRTAGGDGEVYELSGVGGQAHLQDDTRNVIYVDTDTSGWQRIDNTTRGSTFDTSSDPNDDSVAIMTLKIPQGTAVDGTAGASQSRAVAAYLPMALAGQKMARVSFSWDTGLTSANLVASVYAATKGVGAADVAFTTTFNTAGGGAARAVVTDWTLGRNRPIIRMHYTVASAGTVSADTWWLQFSDMVVRTVLMDRSGNEITTGYVSNTVLASEVVADLLGRFLGATIDGPNATIDATAFGIEQLAYVDGASPQKVIEDLLTFESAYTWHVWETNPTTGKFAFEWVQLPTTVRYEADAVDGFSSPSSGASVYNKVAVRYRNRGLIYMEYRTQAVPMLDDLNLTRTGYIDLGDEAASQVNAQRAGDEWLADHRFPVNGGSLVVRRPILDILNGRMVQPWEIRPGQLIRVRGVEPYSDASNPGIRDGRTVFKIASTSFSASDAATTCALDAYTPSLARALASAVQKRPVTRRR